MKFDSFFQTSPSRKFHANTPSDSLKLQIFVAIEMLVNRETAKITSMKNLEMCFIFKSQTEAVLMTIVA